MDGRPAIAAKLERILQDLLCSLLFLSVQPGLINTSDLIVSGNGSSVVSHTYSYGHKTADSSIKNQYRYSDSDDG